MTLGGFALAVGILVDNGTVDIENIERHVKLGEELNEAIVTGCGEVGVPTMLSTLSNSIVFVPFCCKVPQNTYSFCLRIVDSKPCSLLYPRSDLIQLLDALVGRTARARIRKCYGRAPRVEPFHIH